MERLVVLLCAVARVKDCLLILAAHHIKACKMVIIHSFFIYYNILIVVKYNFLREKLCCVVVDLCINYAARVICRVECNAAEHFASVLEYAGLHRHGSRRGLVVTKLVVVAYTPRIYASVISDDRRASAVYRSRSNPSESGRYIIIEVCVAALYVYRVKFQICRSGNLVLSALIVCIVTPYIHSSALEYSG